ncbi:hypothetical protein K8089_12505 [Aequorivita sp. F47161]|uniref:Uncharacterized protein n=1 Tax=Aequorivita vitellina TaxID=2874475 RepID=A0A9X1QY07_9FLAO|nr:hypothetical protein [Aequorivita vitellina]MCG2419844.1 hypothetical protein [Aequorivita vitellina]MCZ4318684.1 hypothetical protein [Aequorivita viscosa]
MNYRVLLISIFSLIVAASCKEPNNKTTEPITPAETRATMEYNENRLDTVAEHTQINEDFSFSGGGTDPFWTVEFKGGQIHFTAPGETLRSFVAPIPEPEISGNTTKYIATSHRVLMEVLLTKEECITPTNSKKNTHKVKVSIKPKAAEDFNYYYGCGS